MAKVADEGCALLASSRSDAPTRVGSASVSRCESGKHCVICLEELDPESGDFIALECDCKGDIRLRHKSCAMKWASIKRSTVCDICKAPIRNLPDIDAMPPPELHEPLTPQFYGPEEVPPALDLSFDFLRITWIACIICVLFIQLDLQESLWIGSLFGLCYVLLVKVIDCCAKRATSLAAHDSPAQVGEETL